MSGSLASVCRIKTFSFVFEIPDFLNVIQRKVNGPVFVANGLRWRIVVYPNGHTSFTEGLVSVMLSSMCLDEETIDVRFKLCLVDTDRDRYGTYSRTGCFNGTHDSYGGHMVSRNTLLERGRDFLPNGRLIITCEMEYPGTSGRDSGASNISQNMRRRLKDDRFYDFVIRVGQEEVLTHRFILSGGSVVFDAMLQPWTKEYQDQEMVISDFSFPVIKSLVSFLRTGRIKGSEINEELLRASDKYCVPGLKARCERLLACDINELNAVDTLIASDEGNSPRLQTVALCFVANNVKKVMETDAWKRRMRNRFDLMELILCEIVGDQ
jgi:BTB/POZ domain